jgi:hypothetical protein
MSSQLAQRFIKRSSETAALFHHFPGAIYEFRDRIWRVKQLQGNVPRNVFMSDAFRRLLDTLQSQNIQVQTCTTPKQGMAEIFPMSWYCANPSCNKFITGELNARECPSCGGEMRQLPIMVICDSCGHIDAIRVQPCKRCHSTSSLRLVMYDRNNLGSWRIVCQHCLNNILRREGISPNRPQSFKRFEKEFSVWSDLEPGASCPNCRAKQSTDPQNPGKRIVPASSNIIVPAFTTTFDQDIPTIKSHAITTAEREFSIDENWQALFDRIKRVFAIEEIYLANIVALNCTYGYRVGHCPNIKSFSGGSVYLQSDQCGAVLFQFDANRLPVDTRNSVLHAAAHALLQVVGYITGLGNSAYREYIDSENCAIMIFSPEAGGCDLLVQEPAKMVTWLRRTRSVVHNCKNQCTGGCPWCLHIKTWQCPDLNRNLNRVELANLWKSRFLVGELNGTTKG